MNMGRLTTEDTWREHWTRKECIQLISDSYCYHDFIKHAIEKLPPNGSCIELGGFPGKFSIFLKKYCGLNPTLLDFHFDETILKALVEFNGLQQKDIKCIQADLFSHEPIEQYDMVCSFGLIEHFIDLKEVLQSHVKYLKSGAVLLIALPNFRGVNGVLQKYFDPANLIIHNIDILDPALLANALEEIGMVEIEASYYPSTQVWLEDLKHKGIFLNILIRVVNRLMGLSGKIFGMQNRMLSNSIIVSARSRRLEEK